MATEEVGAGYFASRGTTIRKARAPSRVQLVSCDAGAGSTAQQFRIAESHMPPEPKHDRGQTIRTGIAGEFFVAAELSKRGWIATLTAKNTPDVDVLASRPIGDTHARIQVKTRTPAYAYAHRVGKKLSLVGERDFLVLVDLGHEGEPPRYWILPTLIAVDLITNEQIRTKDVDEFEDRWDLLG